MRKKSDPSINEANPPSWMKKYSKDKDPWTLVYEQMELANMVLDDARWTFFDTHKWEFIRKKVFALTGPKEKNIKSDLIYHLNRALDLHPNVEQAVEQKNFDSSFLSLWSMYMGEIGAVDALLPHYRKLSPGIVKGLKEEKFEERRWFAAWYIYVEAKLRSKGKSTSREAITLKIEDYLSDIWTIERKVKPQHAKKVQALLKEMAQNKNDREGFFLSGNFTKKLTSERLELFLKDVRRNPQGLPPAGDTLFV